MSFRAGLRAMTLLAAALLPGDAQAAIRVEGRVLGAFSGQPVAGASVRAEGRHATTDAEGRFVLDLSGPAVVEASAPGHLDAARTVEQGVFDLVLYLLERDRFQEEVVVSASAAPEAGPDVLEVRTRDVLAAAGGADNVFRVVQLLPGVAGTDEFGGRLAVRGGAPDQNLTVLDGVEIHNPYRLLGLTSAFNPETVQGFELTAGAFEARYGDRLSSLLVVRSRYGTESRSLAGSSALGLTDANVLLEGKLPRASGSWLLTTRRTYYDLVAERFVDSDLPSFADVQAKVSWQPRPGQRLTLLGLVSRESTDALFEGDRPGERGAFVTAARNDLVAATFQSDLGARALSRTILGVYDNTERLDVDALFRNTSRRSNAPGEEDGFARAEVAFERDLGVRDLSLRQEVSWQASDRHLFEAGAELHRLATDVGWVIAGDRNPGEANGSSVRGGASLPDALRSALSSTRWGLFVQDRSQATRALVLEPGLRLEGSSVNGDISLQPRLGATLRLGAHTRLRAALGRHAQSPGYEKLVQADYFLDLTGDGRLDLRSERSTQAVLGWERDFGGALSLRAEAYYKRLDGLIVGALEDEAARSTRLAAYDFPPELSDSIPGMAQITTEPTNDGRGRAWGLDVLATLRPGEGPVSGWLSYTWGRAERTAYGRTYPFEYDRRHAAAAVLSWNASPRLEVAVTARAASGFPRTPALGVRVAGVEDASDRDADGDRAELVPERDASGRLVYTPDLGGLDNVNRARLPAFARLDLRVTFRPKGPSGRWWLYLDVLNATNRKNAGALDARLVHDPNADRPRIVEERQGSIPFLPSVGVRFRF